MNIYQKLMDKYIIKSTKSNIWEEIGGYKKQYRCTLYFNLVIIVLLTLKISIEREIGAPSHG